MGFLDRFRRKPRAPEPPTSGDADPRPAHYVFAHYALRGIALSHPEQCLAVLASDEAKRFLAAILNSVNEQLGASEPAADFTAEDIRIQTTRAGDHPCAVIEMPPARATAEAHFVAIVLPGGFGEQPAGAAPLPARYFTLEKGFELSGEPRTVLCEWTADGTHSNFGDGPPPTVADFVAAIADHVQST